MPARRKRELGERRVRRCRRRGGIGRGGVGGRTRDLIAVQLDLGPTGFGPIDFRERFEGEDRGVERAVPVAEAHGAAVPAAVGELVGQQPLEGGLDVRVIDPEVVGKGQVHGGDAGLGGVDRRRRGQAAVEVAGAVPDELHAASGSRLAVRETASPEEEERVGGGGPLRAVEPATPGPIGVLVLQESSPPPRGRHECSLTFEQLRWLIEQVATCLPADGRVASQEPVDQTVAVVVRIGHCAPAPWTWDPSSRTNRIAVQSPTSRSCPDAEVRVGPRGMMG